MKGIKVFTPLESPAACSGDEPRKTSGLLRGEDIIPFTPLEIMPRCSAAGSDFRIIPAGFNAPLEFLTG